MNPRIVVINDWPPPDTVTPAVVWAGPSALVVGYGTGQGQAAVITFPNWVDVKVGGPNDEALNGHPLVRETTAANATAEVFDSHHQALQHIRRHIDA